MKSTARLIAVISIFALVLLACGSQAGTPTTAPGSVETLVAATMQALTAAVPTTLPPTDVPTEAPGLLPHSLYYQKADGSGLLQVFRLERDGITSRQITFEPANVETYSVNQGDGRLAYVSNNQLLLVNADGSDRRLLVDGGVVDLNAQFMNQLGRPLWSGDGNTIAFGYRGLNFYSLATSSYATALANQVHDMNGIPFPDELYAPEAYSPDGTKLLISIGWYEGGTQGIFIPATGTLVRPNQQGIMCCSESWAPDSSAIYIASPWIGMVTSGMWRFNLDGSVNELIPTQSGNGTYNFAYQAFLAPDGQLYFFYNNLPNIPDGDPALMLVRSAADGVTGRISVLPQYFQTIHEALWYQDASAVILVQPTAPDQWSGGAATLYFTDGSPAVSLLSAAQAISWGP
jgi:hypothetical protein